MRGALLTSVPFCGGGVSLLLATLSPARGAFKPSSLSHESRLPVATGGMRMPDGTPPALKPVGDTAKPSPSVKREDHSSGAGPSTSASHRLPASNGSSAGHSGGLSSAAAASLQAGYGAHNHAGPGPPQGAPSPSSALLKAAGPGVSPVKAATGASGNPAGVLVTGPSQLSAAMMTATAENAGGGGAGFLAQMRATGAIQNNNIFIFLLNIFYLKK